MTGAAADSRADARAARAAAWSSRTAGGLPARRGRRGGCRRAGSPARGGGAGARHRGHGAAAAGARSSPASFGTGIPGAAPFTQHLTLWVAFLGAAIAAREGKLLALATGDLFPEGTPREAAAAVAGGVGAAVSALLARAALRDGAGRARGGRRGGGRHPDLGRAARAARRLRDRSRCASSGSPRRGRGRAASPRVGLLAGVVLGQFPQLLDGKPAWPGLVAAARRHRARQPDLRRARRRSRCCSSWPTACRSRRCRSRPIGSRSRRCSRRCRCSPSPASCSPRARSSQRLLARLPRPLRLDARRHRGGLRAGVRLLHHLHRRLGRDHPGARRRCSSRRCSPSATRERFSLGLLTASGSLGLLLPPALPLILYGIVAQRARSRTSSSAACCPGLLMVGAHRRLGRARGRRSSGIARQPFRARARSARALWAAKWELLLPVIVLGADLRRLRHAGRGLGARARSTCCWSRRVVHRDIALRRPALRAPSATAWRWSAGC